MSGSPVYIDGKLIGAVCATFAFSKEPIGFIRPIEDMLKTFDQTYNKKLKREKPIFIPLETELASNLYKENPSVFPESYKVLKKGKNNLKETNIVPVKTPLFISGLNSDIINLIDDELINHGYIPIQSGQTSSQDYPSDVNSDIKPGDAIAICFATGDINMSAVGTVSYRKDNDILIFGHHAFSRGMFEAPLYRAMIYYSVPSYNLSFKVASSLNEIGRTTYDYNSAVSGKIGQKAKMIPVKINVDKKNKNRTYNIKIIRDELFLPNLMALIMLQAISDNDPPSEANTIQFDIKTKVKNLKTGKIDLYSYQDYWTGTLSQKNAFQGLLTFIQPLQSLLFNFYNPVEIVSIEADIKLKPNFNLLNIQSVQVLTSDIRPGDKIELEINMQNYQESIIKKNVIIKIPDNLNVPNILIGVSNSKFEYMTHMNMSKALYIPNNYKQLIEIINKDKNFSNLAVWIDIPRPGIVIDGKALPNIPENQLYIYAGSNKFGNTGFVLDRKKQIYKTNYLVNGLVLIPVFVNLNPRIK